MLSFTIATAETINSDRISEINNFVNSHIEYIRDQDDVWAQPRVTLEREYGDCEDIALLKAFMLMEAGYDREKIRIIIVRVKKTNEYHAVAVFDDWVLDNRIKHIYRYSEITDYYIPYIGIKAYKLID